MAFSNKWDIDIKDESNNKIKIVIDGVSEALDITEKGKELTFDEIRRLLELVKLMNKSGYISMDCKRK